jgi:hypothetical protein
VIDQSLRCYFLHLRMVRLFISRAVSYAPVALFFRGFVKALGASSFGRSSPDGSGSSSNKLKVSHIAETAHPILHLCSTWTSHDILVHRPPTIPSRSPAVGSSGENPTISEPCRGFESSISLLWMYDGVPVPVENGSQEHSAYTYLGQGLRGG